MSRQPSEHDFSYCTRVKGLSKLEVGFGCEVDSCGIPFRGRQHCRIGRRAESDIAFRSGRADCESAGCMSVSPYILRDVVDSATDLVGTSMRLPSQTSSH